jgi:hypothetical protein
MLKVPDLIQLPERSSTIPVSTSHHCVHAAKHVTPGFPNRADGVNLTSPPSRHRRTTDDAQVSIRT